MYPKRADRFARRWRNAVAGVKTTVPTQLLGDHPERLLDTQTADGFAPSGPLHRSTSSEPPLPRASGPCAAETRRRAFRLEGRRGVSTNGATADTNAVLARSRRGSALRRVGSVVAPDRLCRVYLNLAPVILGGADYRPATSCWHGHSRSASATQSIGHRRRPADGVAARCVPPPIEEVVAVASGGRRAFRCDHRRRTGLPWARPHGRRTSPATVAAAAVACGCSPNRARGSDALRPDQLPAPPPSDDRFADAMRALRVNCGTRVARS